LQSNTNRHSEWIIKRGEGGFVTPSYILYNKFLNNQYKNLKLNDYIRQNVVQLILDSRF